MSADVRTFSKDDRYVPFSNGTEHMLWLEGNCMRGERGCRRYRPQASSSRDGCPIEVAIALAGCSDEEGIPMRIALRGDFVRPCAGGRLSDEHLYVTASDGLPAYCPPTCPEYRGYDEPDDRPRRGPRPPREQMDLFDPRNAPDRPKVSA